MKNFKAVDAFCGAGGLSLGLQKSGFEILFGFDNDPKCIQTLKSNPDFVTHSVECANVKDMLGAELLKRLNLKSGELDLLAGGPPCQGFSIQRTVGGNQDIRNLLVDDYGDLIREIMPKFFLLENVPGLGGTRGKVVIERFRLKMASSGYFCHERILDARDYGVPQRRRRYIIVGEYTNNCAPYFIWPEKINFEMNTVRGAIGHLLNIAADGTVSPMHRADKLSPLNRSRLEYLKQGEGRTNLPTSLIAECHKQSAEQIGHRNVYGRMAWDDVAPTITARFDSFTRGQFGHPSLTRSISLLEGALLQTFPENYIFYGNKVDIARQIGNAVPPKLALTLGDSIIAALKSK